MSTKKKYYCVKCRKETYHSHVHDTAYGLDATHIVGTERFVCQLCGKETHRNDSDIAGFNFTLDI